MKRIRETCLCPLLLRKMQNDETIEQYYLQMLGNSKPVFNIEIRFNCKLSQK